MVIRAIKTMKPKRCLGRRSILVGWYIVNGLGSYFTSKQARKKTKWDAHIGIWQHSQPIKLERTDETGTDAYHIYIHIILNELNNMNQCVCERKGHLWAHLTSWTFSLKRDQNCPNKWTNRRKPKKNVNKLLSSHSLLAFYFYFFVHISRTCCTWCCHYYLWYNFNILHILYYRY